MIAQRTLTGELYEKEAIGDNCIIVHVNTTQNVALLCNAVVVDDYIRVN